LCELAILAISISLVLLAPRMVVFYNLLLCFIGAGSLMSKG